MSLLSWLNIPKPPSPSVNAMLQEDSTGMRLDFLSPLKLIHVWLHLPHPINLFSLQGRAECLQDQETGGSQV